MRAKHLAPLAALAAVGCHSINAPPGPGGTCAGTCPEPGFVQALGDGWSEVTDLSVASDGGSVVVGRFAGDLELGGQTFAAPFPDRGFVAALAADGSVRYAFATTPAPGSLAAAALEDGGAVIAGSFRDTLEIAGSTLEAEGDSDLFVLRLDPTGAPVELVTLPANAWVADVVALSDGGFAIGGGYEGPFDVVGDLDAGDGEGVDDGFVARLDDGLALDWATRIGGAHDDDVLALAPLPGGRVAYTLRYEDTVTVGSDAFFAGGVGAYDDVVGALDAGGTPAWTRRAADDATYFTGGVTLAATPDGELAIATLESLDWTQGPTLLRARRIDGAGATLAGWDLGQGSFGRAAIAASGAGVHLAGSFWGEVTLGGETLLAGDGSGFLATFVDGEAQWMETLDGPPVDEFSRAVQLGTHAGAAPDGFLVFAGQYLGNCRVGETDLPAAPDNPKAFVAGF